MSNIKILIVENERIAAQALSATLVDSGYEVIGCCSNGADALQMAAHAQPDLVFMDISIDGAEDGIETARKMKASSNIPIIFLTNIRDDKTIKRAQSVKPANYLVKPFNDSQIPVSISNALYTVSEQREAEVSDNTHEFPDERLKVLEGWFFAKNNSDTYKKYKVSDILYIEASRSYSYICMSNGEKILKTTSMKDVESKLDNPHFLRVSRSHIVNLDQVTGIKGRMLAIGSEEIKASEEYFEDIKRVLNIL